MSMDDLKVLQMNMHERIETKDGEIEIIKVPNGWIYNQSFWIPGGTLREGYYDVTSTFVPDIKRNK